jgi:hypothetical protein
MYTIYRTACDILLFGDIRLGKHLGCESQPVGSAGWGMTWRPMAVTVAACPLMPVRFRVCSVRSVGGLTA